MTKEEFYEEVVKLMPYREDKTVNFRNRLANALKKFGRLAKQYGVTSDVLNEIDYISKKIIEIIRNYEKGLQSTSFIQLQNLIQGKKGLPPRIDLAKNILKYDMGSPISFFRIRQMQSIYEVGPEEMFHIPLSKRGIVKTQRYSTPGYPCLYLGESIYGCWEEMRRPSMQICAVSRLECQKPLNIIDLSRITVNDIDNPYYQKLIPLLISCMIPVEHPDDTYKPEYIMPQLFMEWLLKNRDQLKIDGVCYTSTHINDEFDFPEEKFLNYAIPVYSVDARMKYCKNLCNLLKITKPTTNDIEKLKQGYDLDFGYADLSEEEQKEQNYATSDFGQLEKRLQDTTKFPLTEINYK